jgi:transcriptional regulator with XRE-family HTH domain
MDASRSVDWVGWLDALGAQNRALREFLGLSQNELARLAGVNQASISRLEAGRGLSTPIVVAVKVHRALVERLRRVDPALLRDDVRRMLGRTRRREGAVPATADDPELAELLALYRGLDARERPALLAVVHAAAKALAPSAPVPERRRDRRAS